MSLKDRDILAEDYRQAYAKNGIHDTWEAFQALAAGDLLLTDKVNEELPPAPSQPSRNSLAPPVAETAGPRAAEQMASDLAGGKFQRREIVERPVIDDPRKVLREIRKPKAEALFRRIRLISQVEPNGKRNAYSEIPYRYPALAKDLMSEHADWHLHRRGYRFLSPIDRNRKFLRALEDIADRSNAAFGVGWWVHK